MNKKRNRKIAKNIILFIAGLLGIALTFFSFIMWIFYGAPVAPGRTVTMSWILYPLGSAFIIFYVIYKNRK